MMLHHIRRFVIEKGIMKRCDPSVEMNNQFIFALDGKSREEAMAFADQMRPTGCIFKGNDLLISGVPGEIVSDLSVYGRVMVDLKWHDIPDTVRRYCERLKPYKPWAVTIHASGGSDMIAAAVKVFADTATIVLCITVLTSIKDQCEEICKRKPRGQVQKLVKLAWEAGARGFVCSAEEVSMIRKMYPSAIIVVPGVRSPGANVHDQKRVGTFTQAKKDGASFFVCGRQFFEAKDGPIKEMERVRKEELSVV